MLSSTRTIVPRFAAPAAFHAFLAVCLLPALASAADQAWDGGSTLNGNWSAITNWNGDSAAPGSTTLLNSADVATFNAGVANTWGLAGSPIVIDSTTQNIGGISFTEAAGNYTIGTTGGNALRVSSGGTIQILSTLTATNAIETINAPLIIQGTNGTYALANNSANGTGAGAGTLNIGGAISGGASGSTTLTLSGSNTNANTVSGVISNGSSTSLRVIKSGVGTWILSAANTYTGATVINQGKLQINTAQNLAGGLTFGAASSTTTTGTLDLTNASATFAGAMLVQTDSTNTNMITIGSGQTLTTNGGVNIGPTGTGTANRLTVTGNSGSWVVGGASTSFIVGGSSSQGSSTTLDMSGLGAFTAGTILNPLTLFKIGSTDNDSGTADGGNTVLLATTVTITATTMDIGASTNHFGTKTLRIGVGAGESKTTFNVNTLSIGSTGGKSGGVINFADPTRGELTIRSANGSGAAVLNIISTANNTSAGLSGSLLLAGHAADVLVSTLTMGRRAGGSANNANTGTLTFDAGVFDAATVVMSSRSGDAFIAGGTIANATFGGGTVTLGTVTMSQNVLGAASTTGSAASTLAFNGNGTNSITTLNMGNVSGSGANASGSVSLATLNLDGTAATTIGTLKMAVNAAASAAGANTAQSTINLSGGTLSVTGSITMGDVTGDGKHSYDNAINLIGGILTVDGNITRAATVAATTGTYASTITLNGGTLDMTSGSIGTGANTITLIAQSGTLQNLAELNGGGAFIKTTAGTLILSGTNTYTGATTVSAGVLLAGVSSVAGVSGAFGNNSAVIMSDVAGATLDITGFNTQIGSLAGGGSMGGNVILGAATLTVGGDNTSPAEYAGVISGAGRLTKIGTGVQVLGGTNLYTGGTTLSAGTLSVASIGNGGVSGNLGAATNAAANLVFGGGTLQYTGGIVSTDRNFTLTAGTTSAIEVSNSASNLTISGASTATTGALTKTGAGTLSLSGSNTYTGATLISAGTLSIGSGGTTGSLSTNSVITNNATLVFNRSNTITQGSHFATGIGGSGAVIQLGQGTTVLVGANTYSGTTTISAGTLQLGNGSMDGTINNSPSIVVAGLGLLNFNNATAQAYNGSISNSGTVTKTGAGNLTLSGTFTRAVGSTLNVQGTGVVTATMTGLSTNNAAGIIGAWATISTGTSTAYATFSGSTITALTGTAAATAANLTDTTGLVNYDLAIATGTIPATVSANTIRYTGGTATTTLGATSFTVNGLMATAVSGFATPWNISGNTLTIGADRDLVVAPRLNNSIAISSIIRDNGGGASALTKAGPGTVSITGANTYTGPTTIIAGELRIGTNGSLSLSSTITVNSGATLSFAQTNTLTQGIDFNSVISGTGRVMQFYNIPGTTVLTGANTYTGGTTIDGGTLIFRNTNARPSVGTITVYAGATLGLGVAASGNFFTSTDVDSFFAGTLAGVTRDAASRIGIDTTAGDFTYASSVASSTVGLTKLGAGVLTLSGTSNYTGVTTLIGGTLSVATIGNGGVAGNMGAATSAAANLVFNGGTLQYTGATASTNRNFTLTTGTTSTIKVTQSASELTLSGASTSTNAVLTKAGAGTLILTGANLHFGGITVNAGTLLSSNTASANNTLGTGALSIGVAGTYSVITGGTIQPVYTNAVSGAGAFNVSGSGGNQSFWSGSWSGFSGLLTISGGNTGMWVRGSNTGSTTMKLNMVGTGGSLLGLYDQANTTSTYNVGELSGAAGSLIWSEPNSNNNITLSVGALNTSSTYGGEIRNNWGGITNITSKMGLTKGGAGTFTLTGTNYYTGVTTISGGKLSVASIGNGGVAGNMGAATNAAANLVFNGGTLQYTGGTASTNRNFTLSAGTTSAIEVANSASNLTISGSSTATTGALTKTGAGTLTLSSANLHTGGTTVAAGVLNVTNSSGSATGSGALTVEATGILSGTGIIATGANTITLDGTVSVGSNSSAAASLALGTTSGSVILGATGSMRFDLFSGAGAGDNTLSLTASDLLILTGDVSILSGALLYIDNPNSMTNWAKGDMWKLWNVSGVGTIIGNVSLANIIGPALGGDRVFSFDSSTGILSIVPEPGRAMLLLLGLMAMVGRRRRC